MRAPSQGDGHRHPDFEAGFWHFFYFATERGRRGLAANRCGIAKVIWTATHRAWHFDDAFLRQ